MHLNFFDTKEELLIMKKETGNFKLMGGLIVGVIIGGATVVGANQAIQAMQNTEIKVSLNGQIQDFKDETTGETQYPITYNNRTYLPLRNVAELSGLNVDYDVQNKEAKLKSNNISNSNTTIKIDQNKSYVYNANYKKDVKITQFINVWGDRVYSDAINVPYININSEYAKMTNNEIKEQFDHIVKAYNTGATQNESGEYGPNYIDVCTYTNYEDEDTLSVLFFYGLGATDIPWPDYYTYNFDLKDGSKLSFESLCNKRGIKNDEAKALIEKNLKQAHEETVNYLEKDEKEKYYNETMKNFEEAFSKDEIQYFLNSEGELQVIVKLYTAAGRGWIDQIITVK